MPIHLIFFLLWTLVNAGIIYLTFTEHMDYSGGKIMVGLTSSVLGLGLLWHRDWNDFLWFIFIIYSAHFLLDVTGFADRYGSKKNIGVALITFSFNVGVWIGVYKLYEFLLTLTPAV